MATKILAIDDSKTMRLAIKITFAAEEAEVVAVSKGSEAVARAKSMGADIVLVDHKLGAGEPSGFDVVRALRADAATATMPVLLLVPAVGGVSDSDVSDCGADGSMKKPFDSAELIERVGQLAGKPSSAKATAAPAAAAAAAPAPAARPAVAAPPRAAARPAPAPAPRPAAARPSPAPAPRPAPARPAAVSRPAAARPAAARPAAARPAPGAGSGTIPIAVPIPFASAGAPTPGMLKRLEAAGGGGAEGLTPQAVQALLSLSHEVVERVVWEVVPELAEQIIKSRA